MWVREADESPGDIKGWGGRCNQCRGVIWGEAESRAPSWVISIKVFMFIFIHVHCGAGFYHVLGIRGGESPISLPLPGRW